MKLPGKLTEIIKGAFDNHRWASLAPTGLSLPADGGGVRSLLVKVGSDPEHRTALVPLTTTSHPDPLPARQNMKDCVSTHWLLPTGLHHSLASLHVQRVSYIVVKNL